MDYFVYIIKSERTARYYIGQTSDLNVRLTQHNAIENVHFTSRDAPWSLCVSVRCTSRTQAMMLEAFIKKQKSRVFIEKVIADDAVQNSLIQKFADC